MPNHLCQINRTALEVRVEPLNNLALQPSSYKRKSMLFCRISDITCRTQLIKFGIFVFFTIWNRIYRTPCHAVKNHFFVKLQYEHQSTHLKVNILKKWAVEMEGQSKWYKIISYHYAEIPVTFNNHQLTQEIEVRYLKMHVYWELYWKDNTGSTNSRKCTGTLKDNPNSRWKAK